MTAQDTHALLERLIARARALGADAADAVLLDSTDLSVSCRMGDVEDLSRSETGDVGLRVFVGKRQAMASSSDRGDDALTQLAERAVAMAKLAPEDPFCGLAEAGQIARDFPVLEICDDTDIAAEQLIERARAAEDAARAVVGVTNSEGASAGWGRTGVTVAASNGFVGSYRRSGYSMGVSVLAGTGTGMQRDYDYATRVFAADLPDPASIGRKAGERAVKRLNPRKMPSAQVPVFFDPRIAGSLIGIMTGAISGAAVARGTSFLKDKLGKQVFASGITVCEDPFRARGLRSRAFDAEGLLPRARKLIDDGVLTTWLLDLRSSRQLGLAPTGHATRGVGGPPSPSASNLYVQPGTLTPAQMMADVSQGFYVTEVMGSGINGVTGDYSQAAAGFWIDKGEVAFAVNEVTIAGNLKDMYMHMSAANDLEFLRGIDAPTLRVDGMTVAGL